MLYRRSSKYVFSLGQRNFCYSTLSQLLCKLHKRVEYDGIKQKKMQSFTKLVGFYLLVTSYLFKLYWNTSSVPSCSEFLINLWLCVLLLTSWGFTYVQHWSFSSLLLYHNSFQLFKLNKRTWVYVQNVPRRRTWKLWHFRRIKNIISNELFSLAFFYPQSLFAPYYWIIRHHSHFPGNWADTYSSVKWV